MRGGGVVVCVAVCLKPQEHKDFGGKTVRALQRVLLTLCRPTMECTANFKGPTRTMPPGWGRQWRRLVTEYSVGRARAHVTV